MTVAIAQRFGDAIVLAADTRITDRAASRQNIIPGRLKAIILSSRLSVAYAGHADPALAAIRACEEMLRASGEDAAIDVLLKATKRTDVDIDYLCALYPNRALKLSNGRLSESQNGFAIGDHRVLSAVRSRTAQLEFHYSNWTFPSPEQKPTDRDVFIQAFQEVLADVTGAGFDGVGGLPVLLDATPNGHLYVGLGGSRYVGPTFTADDSHNAASAKASGLTRFYFGVVPSHTPNVGVLGAVAPQAGLGWIHDPLRADEAIAYRIGPMQNDDLGPPISAMTALVDAYVATHYAA